MRVSISSRQIDLKSEDIKIILEKITPWVFRSFWFWKNFGKILREYLVKKKRKIIFDYLLEGTWT
jgi:hypothetical protein